LISTIITFVVGSSRGSVLGNGGSSHHQQHGVANKPHLHPNVLSSNKESIYHLVNNLETTMDVALEDVLSDATSINFAITEVVHHYGEVDYDQPGTDTSNTRHWRPTFPDYMVQITAKLDENTIKLEEQSVKVDRAIAELKEQNSNLDASLGLDNIHNTFNEKLRDSNQQHLIGSWRSLHPSLRISRRCYHLTSTTS
jgi:hypothetical protein